MKIINAARLSGILFLIAGLITLFMTRTGLDMTGPFLARQTWLLANGTLWAASWWLWLVAIFSWMLLLVAFMWSYLPAHRIPTMLQMGLMIIGAVLTMAGLIIWMRVLPFAMAQGNAASVAPLVDMFALTFLAAGIFMDGIVTAWIAYDLTREDVIPNWWAAPGFIAGLLIAPIPFIMPHMYLLLAGWLVWLVWCLFLGARREMPNAFSEWL